MRGRGGQVGLPSVRTQSLESSREGGVGAGSWTETGARVEWTSLRTFLLRTMTRMNRYHHTLALESVPV